MIKKNWGTFVFGAVVAFGGAALSLDWVSVSDEATAGRITAAVGIAVMIAKALQTAWAKD